jgi:hypothetical protein
MPAWYVPINPATWEAKTGGSQAQDQQGKVGETLSQNQNKT